MLIYYAECYTIGSEHNGMYLQEIPEFDYKCVRTTLGVYGFRLLKKETTTIDKKMIDSDGTYYTGFFYPNGKVYTIEEVKEKFPQDIAFHEYIEKRGWEKVVLTRSGIWRPFGENDQIYEDNVKQEEEEKDEKEPESTKNSTQHYQLIQLRSPIVKNKKKFSFFISWWKQIFKNA